MRDKTEQIMQAAVRVFVKKGLQATTQELANEADVAEVTLYRKFGSKQKLFMTVIKSVLEKQFHSKLLKYAKSDDTETFLNRLIRDRLNVLSRNRDLVKMLISESLMGNLPAEIDIPETIFQSLKEGLQVHAEENGLEIDTRIWATQLSGIFLSHLILSSDEPFHELAENEQEKLLKAYTASVMVHLNK